MAVTLDPTFALGHAALALFGHELCAPVDIDARLRDARLHVRRGTERERSHVDAIAEHVARRLRSPGRAPRGYPRDALLLSAAVPTIAFAGVNSVPEDAWEIVERRAPAYGDDWWFAGLLAFMRQEQGLFDEAMDAGVPVPRHRAGRRPLRARPGARALRDRRPPRRPGLDGRLDHRGRRPGRQPLALLLARRPARAVAGRPGRRAGALRGPAAPRGRAGLPEPGRLRLAAAGAGP